MDLKDLKTLVRQGEGLHLEFKLKANHPEKILKEFVAFANSEGGILLVGVNDDKTIEGLKFPIEDEYILTKAVQENCFPPIAYTLERLVVDNDREVLIFTIPKSDTAPHYTLESLHYNQEKEKKTYIRVADKCIQASKEMKEIIKKRKKEKNFKFNYGNKEKILMQYLQQHPSITIDEFSKTAQISKRIASQTLVLLVLANVLRILPQEIADRFSIVH